MHRREFTTYTYRHYPAGTVRHDSARRAGRQSTPCSIQRRLFMFNLSGLCCCCRLATAATKLNCISATRDKWWPLARKRRDTAKTIFLSLSLSLQCRLQPYASFIDTVCIVSLNDCKILLLEDRSSVGPLCAFWNVEPSSLQCTEARISSRPIMLCFYVLILRFMTFLNI